MLSKILQSISVLELGSKKFNGLVLSTDRSPVPGATVTIGTKTAQTNIKGIFAISDADVKENFAYLKVTKAGFVNGARTLVPTTGNNRINRSCSHRKLLTNVVSFAFEHS